MVSIPPLNTIVSTPPPLSVAEPSPDTTSPKQKIGDRLRKLVGKLAKPSTSQPPSTHQPDEPEATILARTIQNFIDSPHFPTTPSLPTNPTSPLIVPHPLPATTPDPQPQLKESRIVALLSNASFMNGSSPKGKPSIWSILENTRRTSSPNPASTTPEIQEEEEPQPASTIYHTQIPNESSQSMVFSDTSSIMVYSPLFPTQSDFVELAELVPFEGEEVQTEIDQERTVVNSDLDGNVDVGSAGSKEVRGGATSWNLMWPFSIWYSQDQAGSSTTSPQVGTTNNLRPVKSQKSIRAWVPSSSKISVQAFWWGYRLYLPPPILEILSDKTLEATKRSAVITTALTWFFNNLPIDVFPPPMKPVLILLQRLVPLLGYIGTFISWSWNTIRSYDIGYGVTLTATWILPVALIPGTWYDRDFPKSPIPNSPTIPLPRPLSIHSFIPPTPVTTLTTSPSVYATPMSSVVFNSSTLPPDENWGFDPSLASSSTLRSSYAPLPPSSPPIHHPTTVLPTSSSSSSSLYLTPNSSTPAATPTHRSSVQLPTPTSPLTSWSSYSPLPPPPRTPSPITSSSSSSLYLTPNSSTPATTHRSSFQLPTPTSPTPPPTPRLTIPPSSSSKTRNTSQNNRVRSSSPLTPHPIPIPPTPTDLPPIPPELPLSPKLVNLLLRGPVLQTVPLPDVDGGGSGGVGLNGINGVDRNSLWKKKK